MRRLDWLYRGIFQKIFLAVLGFQALMALNRDVTQKRYANFDEWFADLIPASFGLILSAFFMSAIGYGIYKLATRKKSPKP
jgi:hypothetical protein